jgi:hypothetical protein
MPRAGGESDKLGNRYEGIWTVGQLLGRESIQAFEVLDRFGIGDETSNRIDNMLIYVGFGSSRQAFANVRCGRTPESCLVNSTASCCSSWSLWSGLALH